jgi:signal transduction histidine kinase
LPNIAYHERSQDKDNLWYDYAAASTALNGLGRFAESQKYLYQASLIIDSSAKNKKAELCRIYSELYRMQGDYKKAFIYLDSASDLEIEFVNEDHSRLIAETTEKFQTEKREQQNKLLVAQVNSQKLQKRNVIIVAIAIALLALLVAIGLWQKQKANKSLQAKNEIINRQVNKLHELNQEKNSLISIVSHDLANPFGVISVWAQVLKQGGSQLNADEKEALQQIQNSAANGRQLIDSILDVEKASTGNIEMKLEPLECKKVISDVVQEMQPMAQKKQQQILFEGDTVSILSDKKVLSRICENLVSNAIKYSAEGKTIFVQVKDVNENAVLTVKDEGTGIAEDELPLLFTKYSRLSSKTTGGEKSTGLGLSIVKRLVTELNGKIVAESTVGKGSSFTVTIPK